MTVAQETCTGFFALYMHILNEEVLLRIQERDMILCNSIKKQKLAFAGHVLRGSSGERATQILEGKLDSKIAQGRPRRMWIDDIVLDEPGYIRKNQTSCTRQM